MSALIGAGATGLLLTTGGGCGGGGSGGSGGTGGHGGTGGSLDAAAGSGGHGGSGGADAGGDVAADTHPGSDAAVGSVSYTFNTGDEGFAIDPVPGTNPTNLGAPMDGGTAPTIAFDSATGMPNPGSLHITATFTDYNQVVNVRIVLSAGTVNLTGKTLTGEVRLDAPPGADASAAGAFTGMTQLYVVTSPSPPAPSPGFYYGNGPQVALPDNNWHELTLNLAQPLFKATGFDPSTIVQLGVQFASPQPAASDAAIPAFGAPQSVSFHFDSLVSN
jgi:hypothetical protein